MILALGIKRMKNEKEESFLKFGDGEIHLKGKSGVMALVGSICMAFSIAAMCGKSHVGGAITDEVKETASTCYQESSNCSAIEWRKIALLEKTKAQVQALDSTSTLFTVLGVPLLFSSIGFGAMRKEEDGQPQSKGKSQAKLPTQKF